MELGKNAELGELIARLNLRGARLSKGHRRIATFITENYDKAVSMTAASLGKCCDCSESTVVRFAVAMGYEGYPELQEALGELVAHRLTAAQRFDRTGAMEIGDVLSTVLKADMLNLRRTQEELSKQDFDKAVGMILSARRIYVMGLRSAAPLAQFMGFYLNMIFDEVFVVSAATGDVFEEIARISGTDVLVGFSFPRYSTRTLEAMRFAKERGAKVVGITDGEMSPLSKLSTVCLHTHTDMASFVDSLAAPLSVINALIVALGVGRRDELSRHFARLEEIWNAHSVYIDNQDA